MMLFKALSHYPSNLMKEKKRKNSQQNCLQPGVSAKFFTPFLSVFVMYHIPSGSHELDKVCLSESDSNI